MLGENLMTVKEAAKTADCSIQRIYNLISQKKVEFTEIEGRYFINKPSLIQSMKTPVTRPHRSGKTDWSALTDYLQKVKEHRVRLPIPLIRQITSTTSALNYPVDFAASMARGRYGVRPYRAIEDAGFDVVQINLAFNPQEGKNTVVEVIVERVDTANQTHEANEEND